jgi:hypothetical protein
MSKYGHLKGFTQIKRDGDRYRKKPVSKGVFVGAGEVKKRPQCHGSETWLGSSTLIAKGEVKQRYPKRTGRMRGMIATRVSYCD